MTRTAIVSDIHANQSALKAVLDDISSQSVDRIICLGDIVGYGPHPCECLDAAREFEFCILGNHDNSALFCPEGFNRSAERAIFWTRKRIEAGPDGLEPSRRRMEFLCGLPRMVVRDDMMFVHGSPRGPTNEYVFPEDSQNTKKMSKLFELVPRVCFQGHTHVPGIFTNDLRFIRPNEIPNGYDLPPATSDEKDPAASRLMINVGSVGQPRDGDPRSCYVIEDEGRIFFRRIEYDIEATVRDVEAEPELDDMLGHRLRDGR